MNHERQQLIYNPKETPFDVTVVGLGNIGSHAALGLARLGARSMTLVDPDHVEDHNLSSQAFDDRDKKVLKVEAIRAKIEAIDPTIKLALNPHMFEEGDVVWHLPGIFLCAVDSLEARRTIAKVLIDLDGFSRPELIVDGRIGGSQVEVHCYLTPEEWLADIPEVADTDPCGGKYIAYSSLGEAAFIVNTVKRFILGEPIWQRVVFHYDSLDVMKSRKLAGRSQGNQFLPEVPRIVSEAQEQTTV